jgi:hypothetical protein
LCQLEELTIDNAQMSQSQISQTMTGCPPQQFFQQQMSQEYSQAMSQGYSHGYGQQPFSQTVDNSPFATMGFGDTI